MDLGSREVGGNREERRVGNLYLDLYERRIKRKKKRKNKYTYLMSHLSSPVKGSISEDEPDVKWRSEEYCLFLYLTTSRDMFYSLSQQFTMN